MYDLPIYHKSSPSPAGFNISFKWHPLCCEVGSHGSPSCWREVDTKVQHDTNHVEANSCSCNNSLGPCPWVQDVCFFRLQHLISFSVFFPVWNCYLLAVAHPFRVILNKYQRELQIVNLMNLWSLVFPGPHSLHKRWEESVNSLQTWICVQTIAQCSTWLKGSLAFCRAFWFHLFGISDRCISAFPLHFQVVQCRALFFGSEPPHSLYKLGSWKAPQTPCTLYCDWCYRLSDTPSTVPSVSIAEANTRKCNCFCPHQCWPDGLTCIQLKLKLCAALCNIVLALSSTLFLQIHVSSNFWNSSAHENAWPHIFVKYRTF